MVNKKPSKAEIKGIQMSQVLSFLLLILMHGLTCKIVQLIKL